MRIITAIALCLLTGCTSRHAVTPTLLDEYNINTIETLRRVQVELDGGTLRWLREESSIDEGTRITETGEAVARTSGEIVRRVIEVSDGTPGIVVDKVAERLYVDFGGGVIVIFERTPNRRAPYRPLIRPLRIGGISFEPSADIHAADFSLLLRGSHEHRIVTEEDKKSAPGRRVTD